MVSASQSISLQSSLQLLHPSAMAASEKLVPKKLKIKLSKANSNSETVSAEVSMKNRSSSCVTVASHSDDIKARFSLSSDSGLTTVSFQEKKMTNKNKPRRYTAVERSTDRAIVVSERYDVEISETHTSKRGPFERLGTPKPKKQKIDRTVFQQCDSILRKLMGQQFSYIFNEPVDPVALKIPDYFSIISKPMDLGTIKSKLEKELYSNTEEFAADVRLTFSNAMRYNPPSNNVHILAKKLKGIFESRWKALDAMWSARFSMVEPQRNTKAKPSRTLNLRKDGPRIQASVSRLSNEVSLASLQRQKLRKDLLEMSKRKLPPLLIDQLRKLGLIGHNDDRIEVDIDAIDEIKVCELQKVLRSYHHLRSMESAHTQSNSGNDSSHQHPPRGNDVPSVRDKSRTSSVCRFCSRVSLNCRCSLNNDIPDGVDTDELSGRENNSACHNGVRHMDHQVKATANRQKSKPDSDSAGCASAVGGDGAPSPGMAAVSEEGSGVSAVYEESAHPSTPDTAAASEEGWGSNTYDEQISPSKALRTAILMTRFADTIVKARQKTLLNNGEKSDPVKMKQEKERLEKQQREERARIEAKIKAAEAAARMKEETEMKQRREKEREAARIALQQVERTVEIYENMEILQDLEMLGAYSPPDYYKVNNPLERLGLFMKDDFLEDEEEEELEKMMMISVDVVEEMDCSGEEEEVVVHNGDVEEGEIA